jgi:hypothetical protein
LTKEQVDEKTWRHFSPVQDETKKVKVKKIESAFYVLASVQLVYERCTPQAYNNNNNNNNNSCNSSTASTARVGTDFAHSRFNVLILFTFVQFLFLGR